MKIVPKTLALGFTGLVAFGLMLFVPAWTLAYWQAWVLLLVIFVVSTLIPSIYLMRRDPAALQRRARGGPVAETRTVQKVVMGGAWLSLAAMFIVSALDHRLGWSRVPVAICLVGVALVVVGLGMATLVIIQNSHAAATIRVEAGQKVVSTGLYGLVRHPMYTGNVIAMIGVPLALGSLWGLIFAIPGVLILALRIRDEETLLQEELVGYREYTQQVRYRLVPCMW
jgi:protein-S-isoprenylcysteine O-methyltransferase Ste14